MSPCRQAMGALVALAVTLAAAVGCDRTPPHTSANALGLDLRQVPLSPRLASEVSASRDALVDRFADPQAAAQLDKFTDLTVRIHRPGTRQAAGDELYALWRADPENFLWIELAAFAHRYLGRKADRDAMYALPALSDTSSAVGNFVLGRRYFGIRDRGEHFRRAAQGLDELRPLQRCWLDRMLAMADREAGSGLAAADRLLASLPASRECGGTRLEMLFWWDISRSLAAQDRLDDALHAAVLGADLARAVDSEFWVLRCGLQAALVLQERQETEAAAELLATCVRSARLKDLSFPQMAGLNQLAAVQRLRGALSQEVATHHEIFDLCLATGDSLNAPRELMNLAETYLLMGSPDSCLTYQQRAAAWVALFPNAENAAALPWRAAEYYCYMGDYATMDSLLAMATSGRPGASLPREEGALLLSTLRKSIESGQPDRAYRVCERIDQIRDRLFDRLPDQNLRADIGIAMADFLTQQGEFQPAQQALAAAESALVSSPDPARTWEWQRTRGRLAAARGDSITARDAYETCLSLAEKTEQPAHLAESRFLLGHLLLETGRPEAARDLFPPLAAGDRYGVPYRARLSALLLRGMTYNAESNWTAALEAFAQVEALVSDRTPRDLLALLWLQQGRARGAMGQFRRAEQDLARAASVLTTSVGDAGKAQQFELSELFADLQRDITEARIELALDSAARRGGTAGHDAWQLAYAFLCRKPAGGELAAFPESGAKAVVFFVGERQSYRWLLGSRSPELTVLPAREALRDLVQPVLADLATPGRPADERALQALAQRLLGGVGSERPTPQSLTIVPDGILHALPWAALPLDDGRTVVDCGPLQILIGGGRSPGPGRSAPDDPRSLSLLAIGVNSAIDAPGATSGLRNLRSAEIEAAEVARQWQPGAAVVRTGRAAAWNRIESGGLGEFGVIHLASHAVAYQGLPGQATLRLADEQGTSALTLPRITRLDLGAELVFLSCCRAARDLDDGGGGIASFARAFIDAGAHNVIASTMVVDDDAARFLATAFYRHWTEGRAPHDALRAAQQETRDHSAAWRHPFYWGFYQMLRSG